MSPIVQHGSVTAPSKPLGETTRGVAPDRHAIALQKFDAYFLQAVLEQALPKKADAVFGKGFSGDVMRSMLAEKVATEISQRGDSSFLSRALTRAGQAAPSTPSGQSPDASAIKSAVTSGE